MDREIQIMVSFPGRLDLPGPAQQRLMERSPVVSFQISLFKYGVVDEI